MDAAAWITVLTQIVLGGAAWRLASKIAIRQEATDRRVDVHETRLGVLEVRTAE